MAEKTTFIKIDRNITEWRWFKDSKVYHVFSLLLIKANVKDHDFERHTIPRGSLATSYESIADACGLSVSSVRRVIKDLEDTGEIEREIKSHYQIIKIVNYDEYQGCSVRTGKPQPLEQADSNQLNRQTTGKRQQYKNDKNDKNGKNEKNRGRSADAATPPDSPSGMKPRNEGTVEDIPERYRKTYRTYAEYYDVRNQ